MVEMTQLYWKPWWADPGQPIGCIDLLDPEERRQILFEWNATARDLPEVTLVAFCFSSQM